MLLGAESNRAAMCQTVNYWCLYPAGTGRDSVVGTATRYGLEGLGVEFRWGGGEIFRAWGPPSLLFNGYRDFSGGKAAGAWL